MRRPAVSDRSLGLVSSRAQAAPSCKSTSALTLPSSGRAFGPPLKSNVRRRQRMHLRISVGSLSLSAFSTTHHQSAGCGSAAPSSAAAARIKVSLVSDGSGASASSHHTRTKAKPVTSPALALRRERVQMLVRVTAPPPMFAATERFATGGSEVSGIIMAVSNSTNPTPNHSFKRTCQGLRPCPSA